MLVLDTHVLVYDALAPARLSARARKAIALLHRAQLVTSEAKLRKLKEVATIW